MTDKKGKAGGSCNLTACQRPHSAIFYNKSTQKHYCYDCAQEINWPGGRSDCIRLYNTPYLCELDEEALKLIPQDSFIAEFVKGKTSKELFR